MKFKVVKNIIYPDFEELKTLTPGDIEDQQWLSNIATFCLQKQRGIQLYVEKKLSDEMNLVDMEGIVYQDIKFPADSVELYFEDPLLPTVIVSRY
jgi:hypothetical protein